MTPFGVGSELYRAYVEEWVRRLGLGDGWARVLEIRTHNPGVELMKSASARSARSLALQLLLFLAACAGGRTDTAAAPPAPDSVAVDDAEQLYCPDFAPWAVEGSMEPPQMLNRGELLASLAAQFRGVREARRTVVTMRVTRTGEVDRLCIKTRSGSEAFDAAVMELAPRLRFEPGTLDGEPRSVNFSVPFEING